MQLAMDAEGRFYGVSFVLAVCVHVLVAAMLWMNWTPVEKSSLLIRPNIVKAELIVMEAPKATPKPAPAKPPPVKPPPPQPKAEPKPQPKPEPKPAPAPAKPAPPKPDIAKEIAKREQAEKQKRLDSLAAATFSDALAQEAEALSDDKNEQAAQTYAQGIYQLIVANWSRPPSARNGMQTRLIVELVPTGDVVSVTIASSSGNEAFDRSAEQAVRKVGKFDVPKDPTLFEKYFRRFPVLFKPEDLLR
jgi:TonB family protein